MENQRSLHVSVPGLGARKSSRHEAPCSTRTCCDCSPAAHGRARRYSRLNFVPSLRALLFGAPFPKGCFLSTLFIDLARGVRNSKRISIQCAIFFICSCSPMRKRRCFRILSHFAPPATQAGLVLASRPTSLIVLLPKYEHCISNSPSPRPFSSSILYFRLLKQTACAQSFQNGSIFQPISLCATCEAASTVNYGTHALDFIRGQWRNRILAVSLSDESSPSTRQSDCTERNCEKPLPRSIGASIFQSRHA